MVYSNKQLGRRSKHRHWLDFIKRCGPGQSARGRSFDKPQRERLQPGTTLISPPHPRQPWFICRRRRPPRPIEMQSLGNKIISCHSQKGNADSSCRKGLGSRVASSLGWIGDLNFDRRPPWRRLPSNILEVAAKSRALLLTSKITATKFKKMTAIGGAGGYKFVDLISSNTAILLCCSKSSDKARMIDRCDKGPCMTR
jgi:hypothetical protein